MKHLKKFGYTENINESYLRYYSKEEAFPKIINLFNLEGIKITDENIKSWSTEKMNYDDVVRGISHIKSIGQDILVYTNKVFAKERISKDNNIKIYDVDDIKKLANKHQKQEILNYFN